MNILCVAAVEDDTNIRKQIEKQTLKPNNIFIHIDKDPAKGINRRRKRIGENQRILMEAVEDLKPDLVWQIESDGEYPEDALETLYADYLHLRDKVKLAYVSGTQVGRHGLYCLGAWKFDEEGFESLDYRLTGLQEVDATGFYCLLAPAKVFLKGLPEWTDEPYGPDVCFGLSLRAQGYRIYCDMDISIGHVIKNGIIYKEQLSTCNARFYQEGNKWNYKQLN